MAAMLNLSKVCCLGVGAAAALTFTASLSAQANVVVSNKPTANMNCSGGVCTPTAKKAVLNVGDLATMLASGDATVKSDSVAQDIAIDAKLSWISTSRLTLDSFHAIAFNKAVVVAGTGALTITVNDGGSGGDFAFCGKGHVEFWDKSSSLIIGGTSYTLVRNMGSLENLARKKPAGFYALMRDDNAQKDGSHAHEFIPDLTGAVEGLGNTVSNFTMSSNDSKVGFFSENHGLIRDLTLTNISVTGRDGLVAGLVAHNSGTVGNSSVSGQISATEKGGYMGGLVAQNDGVITGSHASATVDGSRGYVAGGLVGNNWVDGTIRTSYATGAVTSGDGDHAGGLVGFNSNIVDQSYATGNVSGPVGIGGLLGANEGAGSQNGNVTNVYATGSVTGSGAGGLVGDSEGNPTTISTAYSTGPVSGSAPLGGFAGQDPREVVATSYWDLDTSGISNPAQGAGNPENDPGITGLSDAQLKSGLPSGFDPSIWAQSPAINNGYPYLTNNPPPR